MLRRDSRVKGGSIVAKESFDKEIQFLRMLMLTSGAFNRHQFAERLGISVHTFDKTIKRLKEILGSLHHQLPQEQSRELSEAIRFRYYDSTDPLLLFLFRAKSVKASESHRISLLLAAMDERPMTAMELLDACCSILPAEFPQPDEKTVRSDLKYLEAVGVIKKEAGPRPYRYRVQDDLVRQLSKDELLQLYDYVDIMANTQVPSVQGYLLRDSLKRQLSREGASPHALEPFLYKYHYHSRVLDEAHLFTLLHAIRHRRKVRFLYFSPKSEQSYSSRNTNPLFEKADSEGKLQHALPLKIVYDHQYGRWYLLSYGRMGIHKYRMEGMTQIEADDPVDEAWFEEKQNELDAKIQHSWLIDTGRPVTVRARFYHPGVEPNFVKARVLLQGQWGRIVDEDESSFLYEITVNGTTEIRPWLRSFGSSCEVLEPPKLRQEMITEWKEIQSYYESI